MTTGPSGRPYGWTRFLLYRSSGAIESSQYTSDTFNQRVKIGCYTGPNATGNHVKRESAWSTDAAQDVVATAECPEGYPHGANLRAQLDPAAAYPYAALSNCGLGVTGHDAAELVQQVTGPGQWPQVNLDVPLENDTVAQAGVSGTDLGFATFASDASGTGLFLSFGDSNGPNRTAAGWVNERGNLLAYTTDTDPTDGVTISTWHTAGSTTACNSCASGQCGPCATEAIPWDAATACTVGCGNHPTRGAVMTGPIPNHGFSISDLSGTTWSHFRYQWFFAPKEWWGATPPYLVVHRSALAYSLNNGPWVRGDLDANTNDPVWPADSNMALGTTFFDRRNGWIYLFGTPANPVVSGATVRLARVKSTDASIRDKKQYEYWGGTSAGWVKDTAGNYGPAAVNWVHAAAGALLPPGLNQVRGDMSVIFDHYSERYLLMAYNVPAARIELWQAAQPIGPWSRVGAPLGGTILDSPPPLPYLGSYAPAMWNGWIRRAPTQPNPLQPTKTDLYFLLSHWNPVYNVALWKVRLTHGLKANCIH